jgi:5-(carboxyamino)imidazole ribonucleotide mutase
MTANPANSDQPLVGIVMGSASDWDGSMRFAHEILDRFGVAHESRVLSAHRTPAETIEWAGSAESRGMKVIIAGAGGAAHLAGVVAAHVTIPVLGVPIDSVLNGLDSLLSTVQMPAGIPVATFAIGKPGATNAALFAISILAQSDPTLRERIEKFRADKAKEVLATKLTL